MFNHKLNWQLFLLKHCSGSWQRLQLVQGRSRRWHHRTQRLAQSAVALLLAANLTLLPAQAAGSLFTEQTSTANPFDGVDVGDSSTPSFVDIDGDGDMDAFIGAHDGTINYYKNTGTALAPTFAAQTGTNNPFNGVDVGNSSRPSFADIDGDGDMDAFIGEYSGNILYYQNTGTSLAPVFTAQTAAANPFNGVDVGIVSMPSFADIDRDGDMDAFIGENFGSILYYQNTGTSLAPTFTAQTAAANPFNGVDVGTLSTPSFADIDGDGDMDAFIGEASGSILYYKNTGTSLAPTFTVQTSTANPFNGVDVGSNNAPSFADIDDDGDMDAFIGEFDGFINYYKNMGTLTVSPTFTERTGAANFFNGVDVGFHSTPTFADIDGDGDMDAFIGEHNGTIKYYKNTGSALASTFTAQTGAANPFNGVSVAYNASTFADIDADGDVDAFIGQLNGTINYYKNTGTSLTPVFTVQTGTNNPFNGVNVGTSNAPTFADIDDDGDMDAFIGEADGNINYYQNIGSPLIPAFTEQTSTANPFNGVDVGTNSAPSFADIDGDGDWDAFIGEYDGNINYYKNTGTALTPTFTEQTSTANPFNGVDVGNNGTPSFADVDDDGDMDAFIGKFDGSINYYENTHCSFGSETDSSLAAGDVVQFGNGNSKVVVKVNTLGTLTSLSLVCGAGNHAQSAGAQNTGVYWTLTPNAGASAFNVDMTLPRKNPDANDTLCRYTGTPRFWDCAVNSRTSTDITRTGITQFSDWAVGDPDLGPLMVELATLTAEAEQNQIRIQWQTVSEQNNLGFNLYRATEMDGEQVKLNQELIPAQAPGSGQGADYEFIDEQVEAGQSYYYWLEDVEIDGQTNLHGPISATMNAPTAITLEAFSSQVPSISLWGLISFMLTLLIGGKARRNRGA